MEAQFKGLENIINLKIDDDLRLKTRKRKYIDARSIFTQIAIRKITKSPTKIGSYLNLDHSLIINYRKKFKGIYRTDFEFRNLFNDVLKTYSNNEHIFKKVSPITLKKQIEWHKEQLEKKSELLIKLTS